MNFTDEKDYIMRMIKEMVRVLFSLVLGKKYVSVELEKENKYEVSGKNLENFLNMIDLGQINEAENILLDSIDYTNKNEVRVIINKELSRVNAQAMQKLKEKDIIKIFPTQKPHCTTRLVLKTPKTETSNRTVWLPKTVAELLVQYQKDQKELQEFLGDAYNNYNLVIALENGNPVESRIVRDRFQKLCEQNGYEKVVFHSLRHLSTGYKLKMTNGDVKSVQGDTGHAEAEMVTDVYSEIIDEDRRYNAQKMDEQFYSTLNHDSEMQPQNEEVQPESNGLSDSDMELLQLLKSLTPEMKAMLLKQSASK